MHLRTFSSLALAAASLATGLNLNITALSASNAASTLECWQMDTPFSVSSTAGTSGSASLTLGDVANLSYSVIPAGYDGGVHNAPYNQYVPDPPNTLALELNTNR